MANKNNTVPYNFIGKQDKKLKQKNQSDRHKTGYFCYKTG